MSRMAAWAHGIAADAMETLQSGVPDSRVVSFPYSELSDTDSHLMAPRRDVLEGTYYPCASIYTLPEQTEGATVTFNFGPLSIQTPADAC